MKSKLNLIIAILLFSACNIQERNLRNRETRHNDFKTTNEEILNLRDKIAKFNEVQSSHIGYGGTPSVQYGNYENLLKIATDKELYGLTKDTNYSVATYATFGLIRRKNALFMEVFEQFLLNDQSVNTMKGCNISSNFVSNEIYFEYWNKVRLDSDNEEYALQNDAHLLTLDSLILTKKNIEWSYSNVVFNNRVYSIMYLPLIEHHAVNNEIFDAIEYLYRHHPIQKKEQIIVVLKNYLTREELWPTQYDKIFEMILSFKQDDLNQLLVAELDDIKKHHGEEIMAEYKKILLDNNVKMD